MVLKGIAIVKRISLLQGKVPLLEALVSRQRFSGKMIFDTFEKYFMTNLDF